MNEMKNCDDVIIIGGGPTGLFASFYAGLRDMTVKIIEAKSTLGGKVHVYPEKLIWDIGGQTPILGADFIRQTIKQGLTFDPTVCCEEEVLSIRKEAQHFIVTTNRTAHYSKAVIITAGYGIIQPKSIGLEGEERFKKTNLFYTVPSIQQFAGQRVLLSGGGQSAVDWANTLLHVTDDVTVVYRRQEMSGHEQEIQQLMNSKATVLLNTSIQRLQGDECITSVVVEDEQTKQRQVMETDAVIINHGYERNLKLLEDSNLHLKMHEDYGILGNVFGETSEPGIFAAGDALNYEGKLHLIVGCYQDAVHAVNSAKQYIDPLSEKHEMVSSHNKKLKEKNEKIYATLQ